MAPVPSRSFRDFSTRRIVLEKVADRRIGHESIDPPTAWKWDYRYLIEDRIPETLPFPGLKKSHLMGVPRKYWENGPISGREGESLKVTEIKEVFAQGRRRWAPVIHNGDLNLWRGSTYFFSDDSVIESVSPDNIDGGGRSLHILEKNLRPGSPIVATIFRRDIENEFLPWREFTRRERFSGLLDSDGTEKTTREGNSFYWSNVNTSIREFVSYVRDDKTYCLFNQFVVEEVTSTTTPTSLSEFNDLEYVGTSDGQDNQKFETSRFPISNDSVLAVYVVKTSSSLWHQYSVVDEFTSANQVKVDTDLGILTFGSSTGDTPPPPAGRPIYIAYRATPRIEYEEDGFRENSIAIDADVNPLGQSLNRGFVTLARAELDIASITLETTKESFPGSANTYGPIYVGADYASLFATVYSSTGEVVPNAEVTFFFETTPVFGGLGGDAETAERRTGFDGVARTFYVPPSSVESMGYYVTEVGTGNTLEIDADAGFVEGQEIYTYHILKDDPFTGVPGADTSRGEIEWDSSELNGRKVVFYKWNAEAINPISGTLGAYAPVRPTSITDGYILNYSDTLADPDVEGIGVTVESGSISSAGLGWIKETPSPSWTVNEWNGRTVYVDSLDERRRIVSNTEDTLILAGEFSDLPTGTYSIADRTSNLGAYWVISDRLITVRASAYSPRQGRTIYSNLLKLRISIPDYMKGSYISESLQEIPFGWRIIDDTYDQASALDGATYISINPVAGPYPIVDVIGGDTWKPYSGQSLTEPYPFWPYDAYPGEGIPAPFASFSLSWNSVA